MANRNVTLVRLCKTEKGWRRYPAVIGKNGRVKPGFVRVGAKEKEFKEGRYQLRSYEGSRMVYAEAGEHAGDASAARDQAINLLAAKDSATVAGVKIEETPGRRNLRRELNRFVAATEDRGSAVAAKVYRTASDEFLLVAGKTFAEDLTPDDLSRHLRALRKRGLGDRTIANRHRGVLAFLRYLKLDTKALAPYTPRYEQRLPEVYGEEELRAFFDSLSGDPLKVVYEILLMTGLREQEAVYLAWTSVDLDRGILRVRSNPEYGFKVKDKEQRDLPIPEDLLNELKEYRAAHKKRKLVTGTASDSPNRKLLLSLKRRVRQAGLNCGACEACLERKECERWFLHKFRATFITKLLQSGMDLRTVMKLSGHSDLESVMRYLSPAADEAIKKHVSNVKWI